MERTWPDVCSRRTGRTGTRGGILRGVVVWKEEEEHVVHHCVSKRFRSELLQHGIRAPPKVCWSGAGLRQGVEGPGDRLCVGEPGRLSLEETEW